MKILTIIRVSQTQRATAGGLLSHGQKQWLEIGMLLSQDAKLLLVDEPAAGMTDEETPAPASSALRSPANTPSSSSSTTWSSSRQISAGRKVTVLHQGTVLCEGPVDDVQSDRARDRGLSRPQEACANSAPSTYPMLTVSALELSPIGGSRILRGVEFEARPSGA